MDEDDPMFCYLISLIEGSFRASLQAGMYDDDVDICVESGSTKVCGYIHKGCGVGSWGCPPGLVLIDDGWQSICHDDDDPNQEGMNRTSAVAGAWRCYKKILGADRVELAKAYYKALTASVRKHFYGNGVIASMKHCNEFMFLGTEAISLGRGTISGVRIPQAIQTEHFGYKVAIWYTLPTTAYGWETSYNQIGTCFNLLIPVQNFMLPPGGPIYISDSVGKHNFQLLKSLILPDGSILRCQHYALPTRDCLFEDPLHDGKTMLKIWNLNKVFLEHSTVKEVDGAVSRRRKSASEFSVNVTYLASPKDIEWGHGRNPISLKRIEIFAVYKYKERKLRLVKASENHEITLHPFDYELFVVSPVKVLSRKLLQYAPIG
ncbi:putative galactinol--sucrose galactosyltransferase 5 [Forsythia ovata]|uniref:Galactinol--sucrose galactosyltransferase 5 n=1 Tax=Forsythia ovata TaxID=205694 RepID=A0ABD1P6M9_9LAMI